MTEISLEQLYAALLVMADRSRSRYASQYEPSQDTPAARVVGGDRVVMEKLMALDRAIQDTTERIKKMTADKTPSSYSNEYSRFDDLNSLEARLALDKETLKTMRAAHPYMASEIDAMHASVKIKEAREAAEAAKSALEHTELRIRQHKRALELDEEDVARVKERASEARAAYKKLRRELGRSVSPESEEGK